MTDVAQQFLDDRESEADEWRDQIMNMLNDEDYQYAESTLNGILEFVETEGHITVKQKQAIENIQSNPKDPYGRY